MVSNEKYFFSKFKKSKVGDWQNNSAIIVGCVYFILLGTTNLEMKSALLNLINCILSACRAATCDCLLYLTATVLSKQKSLTYSYNNYKINILKNLYYKMLVPEQNIKIVTLVSHVHSKEI